MLEEEYIKKRQKDEEKQIKLMVKQNKQELKYKQQSQKQQKRKSKSQKPAKKKQKLTNEIQKETQPTTNQSTTNQPTANRSKRQRKKVNYALMINQGNDNEDGGVIEAGSESEGQDECKRCKRQWEGGEDEPEWIRCEKCDQWMHEHCTHLALIFLKMTPTQVHNFNFECDECA
ncbi:glutamic acid-rich protein-like [Clytia hemisphaerica]|uniref:glutamic acid-rich protein-like n=1 Tax=Clytia hemisphaerica TaxID=252671 RepID=UPI0034D67672